MDRINEICKSILSITEGDIKSLQEVINQQKNFSHPLNKSLEHNQHELGKSNESVLESIMQTKKLLVDSAPKK